MNEAQKLKLANILTALASVFAIFQTFLTNPPFSEHQILLIGAIVAYLSLLTTAYKQYLSPEVSNAGTRVTLWVFVATALGGFVTLLTNFNLPDAVQQKVVWFLTVIIAIINILSKQIFPSNAQRARINKLSQQ